MSHCKCSSEEPIERNGKVVDYHRIPVGLVEVTSVAAQFAQARVLEKTPPFRQDGRCRKCGNSEGAAHECATLTAVHTSCGAESVPAPVIGCAVERGKVYVKDGVRYGHPGQIWRDRCEITSGASLRLSSGTRLAADLRSAGAVSPGRAPCPHLWSALDRLLPS